MHSLEVPNAGGIEPELEVMIGSHLYGYATEKSDYDFLGFCCPNLEYILGMKNFFKHLVPTEKQLEAGEDRSIFSALRFFQQLAKPETRTMEILFAPENKIVHCTELGQKVIDNRDIFLSKKLYRRFWGYATSEWRKVKGTALVPIKRTQTEESIIDSIRTTFSPEKAEMDEIISSLYRNRDREEVPITRKLGATRKEDIKKYGYSVKNAAHTLRLLHEGAELLETGRITFPLPDDLISLLIKIRTGEPSLSEIEPLYETALMRLEKAKESSQLPDNVNLDNINELLLEISIKSIGREITIVDSIT